MAGPQLVVGLGNPGPKYLDTRHNVGFMSIERLATELGGAFRQQAKLHGLLADVGQGPSRLRLLMPQTFMNDSGRSIRAALDWFGLLPADLLVIVDDMDLPLGRLRLRASGSAGGHNGLRSAISHLGTQDFPGCASVSVPRRKIRWSARPAPLAMCSGASAPTSGPFSTTCWWRWRRASA